MEIDVTETAIEENLARIQTEVQPQLFVVDEPVAPEVEQSVIEVGHGFFEIPQEEIGDSLLEVGDGEILVQLDCFLVILDLQTPLCQSPSSQTIWL